MSGAPGPQAKEDEALVAEFLQMFQAVQQMMIESEGAESNDRVAEADDDETIVWNNKTDDESKEEEAKLEKELNSKNAKRDIEEAQRINKLLPSLPILGEFVSDHTLLGACAAEMAITKRLRTTAKLVGRAAPIGSDDPGTGLAGEEQATQKAFREAVKARDKEFTKLKKELSKARSPDADDVKGRRAEAAMWLALLETEARLAPPTPLLPLHVGDGSITLPRSPHAPGSLHRGAASQSAGTPRQSSACTAHHRDEP